MTCLHTHESGGGHLSWTLNIAAPPALAEPESPGLFRETGAGQQTGSKTCPEMSTAVHLRPHGNAL
jgi:hypothetical protein